MFPNPTPVFLVLISLFSGAYGQNETTLAPTISDIYKDPRCLPGCFFKSNILMSSSIKAFPQNCSTVCAPDSLFIGYETDLTEKQLTNILKNMKHLIGTLIVMRTQFTSCKFLAPLETIDCYNQATFSVKMNPTMAEIGMTNLTNVSCTIDFSNNGLYKLNVPKLIPVQSTYANYSQIDVEFYGNTPDFCVTVEEMQNFMTYDYVVLDRFERTTGKYCEISNSSVFSQKTCDVGKTTLAALDSGCVNLRGDLLIGKGDEPNVSKLENVETIFGNLHIYGTNLTNTNFFGKLKKVMSITKEKPTILVDYNTALTNATFPSLERILTTVINPIVFNNNSQELLNNPSFCYKLLESIGNETSWKIKFDGKVCDDVAKAAPVKDKLGSNGYSGVAWLVLVCAVQIVLSSLFD